MNTNNVTTVSLPFSHPVYIMAKPVGSLCNLDCKYCYYTEKAKLYKQSSRHVMDEDLLELFTKQYIEMQTESAILFTWHGGEPLMRPITFYKKAIELQKKYARGKYIDNSLQTNGTLITEEWARFFKENNFLIGISIDGPQEFHDEYRRSRSGKPSFRQVMQGIKLLNKYGVEWNAMATINDLTASHPLEFYHFFKEIGCKYIQFTPVVERIYHHPDGRLLASPIEGGTAELADFSVTPQNWGDFLCALFDEWVSQDVGKYFLPIFDSALAGWMGVAPSTCAFAPTCGHAGVIEFNGDVYACDHFVFPGFKLGNIRQKTLAEMMYSHEQMQFGQDKQALLTRQCKECEYMFACNGECPRNRFSFSQYGETGHNYLCEGYRKFFQHIAPYMDYMKHQLQHKEAPANVMQWIKEGMPEYRKQ